MGKILAVSIKKGGAGKTTIAINLSVALQLLGKKVLLIDIDSQRNASRGFGVDPTDNQITILKLMQDNSIPTRNAILKTQFGVDIIPSHKKLARAELSMDPMYMYFIKQTLAPIKDEYDYIIIDTAPQDQYLTLGSLIAADYALIPFEIHPFCYEAIDDMLDIIEDVRKTQNNSIKVAGIVPNKFQTIVTSQKALLEAALEKYNSMLIQHYIPFQVDIYNSQLAGQPLYYYNKLHAGVQIFNQIALHLIGISHE